MSYCYKKKKSISLFVQFLFESAYINNDPDTRSAKRDSKSTQMAKLFKHQTRPLTSMKTEKEKKTLQKKNQINPHHHKQVVLTHPFTWLPKQLHIEPRTTAHQRL